MRRYEQASTLAVLKCFLVGFAVHLIEDCLHDLLVSPIVGSEFFQYVINPLVAGQQVIGRSRRVQSRWACPRGATLSLVSGTVSSAAGPLP